MKGYNFTRGQIQDVLLLKALKKRRPVPLIADLCLWRIISQYCIKCFYDTVHLIYITLDMLITPTPQTTSSNITQRL